MQILYKKFSSYVICAISITADFLPVSSLCFSQKYILSLEYLWLVPSDLFWGTILFFQ